MERGTEMNFSNILKDYLPYKKILQSFNRTPISVSGVTESAQPHLIYALSENSECSSLVVTYTDMEARSLCDELRLYCDNAVVFPSKEYIYYNIENAGHQTENERLYAISRLMEGNTIVIASIDALMQYTIPRDMFSESCIEFEISKIFELEELSEMLVNIGYTREDIVEGVGQFAIRGGILDIFTPNYPNPVRIEFFDNETDSIREFDVYSQCSFEKKKRATVVPVTEMLCDIKKRNEIITELRNRIRAEEMLANPDEEYISNMSADIESFKERVRFPSMDKYVSLIYGYVPTIAEYFDKNDLIFISDPKRIGERTDTFEWEKNELIAHLKLKGVIGKTEKRFYCDSSFLIKELCLKRTILLEPLSHTKNKFECNMRIDFNTRSTVSFHGKIEYLYEDVKKWKKEKYTVIILVSARGRGENLAGVLNERGLSARVSYDGEDFQEGEVIIMRGNIKKGYEYPDRKLVVVSDREIFEVKKSRSRRESNNANRIKSYNDINPGDYVVHVSHGIGQYMGTEKMVINRTVKDYLKIQYHGTDVLYIPVDQLDLLYKYNGDPEKKIRLNKLGTQEWNRTKARVKKVTEELAQELIELYAKRASAEGYAFAADTVWQREFEDTFPFQETSDQLRSIEEVKADMEKKKPMDRLLCGDVGFGKTEIALRAAFKAVNDSKQVAYLCPTTVLAMQHYETFLSRMKGFPIKVEMISRFRSAAAQRQIIKKLKTGEIDIVIGTHRLLSKDIVFKDLGLLVVDEEQRFGVGHKERIKEMKTNVDVLTMTATPIPRTLHMAMTSIRDMSVLTEPPSNRYPVQTYVMEFNPSVILDGIRNELSRGGQVFYLYNRVKDIYSKAQWLKNCFPEKNIVVAHGQMHEDELEEIMLDMIEGRIDILVCTTIIETGLDIPNANTMIIENADKMGLAQLYQLRGRVGRSNRAAYAYLTYHPHKELTEVAQKRLRAIREFTEFGSGFKIAMRDLEIRGAGNILGAQQHGHMEAVGYDMYCKILQESIGEISGENTKESMNVSIDLNVSAYIPESYISNHNQRIDIYKKIAAIECEEDKLQIEDELVDRYGDYPGAVQSIIDVAALKINARRCGVFEIKQTGAMLLLKLIPESVSASLIFELDKQYPKRIKLISGEEPAISIKITDHDKDILKFTHDLLSFIDGYINNTQA